MKMDEATKIEIMKRFVSANNWTIDITATFDRMAESLRDIPRLIDIVEQQEREIKKLKGQIKRK